MTQIDRPPFYRSDAHDDAVLTGPIPGLPLVRGATPPAGTPPQHATPHPSSPLPVQSAPPPRRSDGFATAALVVAVVGAVLFLIVGVFAGGVTDVALPSTAVHQVTYEVSTAAGSEITATYTRSEGGDPTSASVSGTRSPWSANAQLARVVGPTVTASLRPSSGRANRSDTITCTIVEDGVQVARDSAAGEDAMVTCTT
ncbi:MAG: rane protein [Actinomycetota bacterium]|jgi:hypothetical protein|nr:rane protein [Actinomycetota bacterium]